MAKTTKAAATKAVKNTTLKKAGAKKAAVKKAAPKKATAKAATKKAAAKLPAKKAPLKKSSFPKPDMPKLLEVFEVLKKLMKKYEPPFNARVDIQGKYDLWSEKPVEAYGRRYDSMSFSSLIIQTGYVGFYFMPIYSEPAKLGKLFKPELMKLLKGKACFHVKQLTPELEAQIRYALEVGYKEYKEKGWV